MSHRVADICYREGWISCTCGELVAEPDDPAGDRNEGLASAFQEHRRANGGRTVSWFDASRSDRTTPFNIRFSVRAPR